MAAQHDLTFMQKLIRYKAVNSSISTATTEKMKNHLWHLSEKLAVISLFDSRIKNEVKEQMIVNLKNRDGFNTKAKNFEMRQEDLEGFLQKDMSDFVSKDSMFIFTAFDLPYDLEKDVNFWVLDGSYSECVKFFDKLTVVNDVAERGVALMEHYNKCFTKNEEKLQYLLITCHKYHLMTKREKQKYIKKHFSKQCIIYLSDVRKSKYLKNMKHKLNIKPEGGTGRKKHSCYICFAKFSTKTELEEHKFIHCDEKDNNTFSDDDEANEESPCSNEITESKTEDDNTFSDDKEAEVKTLYSKETGSSKKEEELINCDDETSREATSLETENEDVTSDENKPKDGEYLQVETNYKCLKCNVFFSNQIDVKAHIHTQYFCKYYCKLCDRHFNTKGGFIVHVLQHGMTNVSKFSYKCDKCCFSFDDCYQLKRHYVSVHSIVTQSTAKSAESSVKSKDTLPSSGQVKQFEKIQPSSNTESTEEHLLEIKEKTSEKSQLCSSTASNEKVNPLEQFKEDCINPITGSIPIYDCDICYDVFSSAKALSRHKSWHKELENKSDFNNSDLIVIEDDETPVDPKDHSFAKHELGSYMVSQASSLPNRTTTPMARLSPIVPTSKKTSLLLSSKKRNEKTILPRLNVTPTGKLSPVSQSSETTSVTPVSKADLVPSQAKITGDKQTGANPSKDTSSSVDKSFDKIAITSEITKMMAGRKPWPKMPIPRLVPVSHPRSVRLPPKSVNNKITPSNIISPNVINQGPASPKPSEIVLPAGSSKVTEGSQPQYMYVLCPSNSTQSTGMASVGQTMMTIDPSATATSSVPNFILKNSGATNSNTVMPISGQNQFIINQQINTGGVVINPQAGGIPGSFILNQNFKGQSVSLQEPPLLQPIGEGTERGQMFYIIMPSNQVTSNEVTTSAKPQVLEKQIKPEMKSVLRQRLKQEKTNNSKEIKADSSTAVNPESLEKPSNIVDPKQADMRQPFLNLNRTTEEQSIATDNSNSSEPMVMPIITSVVGKSDDTFELSGNGSDENNLQDSQQDDSSIVMPIITSIGTVAEDSSNKKEKIRKDPVSKYESEFAKFLEKSDDVSTKCNIFGRPVRRIKNASKNNSLKKSAIEKPMTSTTLVEPLSADSFLSADVILLDENSSSNESERSNNFTAISTIENPSQEDKAENAKPKIFVKKLSDLVDSRQASSEESQQFVSQGSTFFKHCCLRCNLQLKDWVQLRIHLKTKHDLYACKFYGCSILKSSYQYSTHLEIHHRCLICKKHFSCLTTHQKYCQETEGNNHNAQSEQGDLGNQSGDSSTTQATFADKSNEGASTDLGS